MLFIVEINCRTQRKEKTGICKSVVIATIVAIRDVVKNGFHCNQHKTEREQIIPLLLIVSGSYIVCNVAGM